LYIYAIHVSTHTHYTHTHTNHHEYALNSRFIVSGMVSKLYYYGNTVGICITFLTIA